MNLLLLLGLGSLPAPSAQDARQVEHHARDAADQHKADNNGYHANNNGMVNGNNNNNGIAHNGVGNGGVGGPMRNGVNNV